MQTDLSKLQQFEHRVSLSHAQLGIPPDYGQRCGLTLCPEPEELVDTELDFYQRPQKLVAAALRSWTLMRATATGDGISLFLISAYRSVEYQHKLIAAKLEKGELIEQVLRVNAAPGFSEHHLGRALDLGTLGCDALVVEFENTDAFQWLMENSATYDFYLSYPRNHASGIAYEPWHWCFQ
ncbi:MAG: M15 family metallopeptidase [Pseudohongiellaceae bacterium]